jgi:hypothetical protein
MENLNGKGIPKKKKLHELFSSVPACFYSAPAYLRAQAWPASCYRSVDADNRDAPVGAFFPQILPCSMLACHRR